LVISSGRLTIPDGVAVDAGDVYVADTANQRIQEFTSDGAFVRSFAQAFLPATSRSIRRATSTS
jgi:sugar lactone lactonase YvrE